MRPAARLASFGAGAATLLLGFFGSAAVALLLSACGSCDSLVRQTPLPAIAANSFDGIATDPSGHRVFLADRSDQAVDVVDTSAASPRLMGAVELGAHPNGLAFSPDQRRLYAGLDDGTVAVVDASSASPSSMRVLNKITVDPTEADLLDYSPQTKDLYVGTSSGHMVVIVDTTTSKVTHRFDVKVPVEQPRYDPTDRKLYVTTPGTDSILQLDPPSGRVTRTYTQKSCRPTGLAINPNRQLALATCRSSTVVFNLRTGLDEISTRVPGGDIVAYDAQLDRFTVGSAHGPRDSAVGVFYGDGRFMGMVASSPNARGAVFDDRSGLLYALSNVGLLSFSPAACAPPPDWLTFVGGAAVFVVPLAAFGLYLFSYARRRSRVDPKASRAVTREQLKQEDLANERERMRALEDAIYGPSDA